MHSNFFYKAGIQNIFLLLAMLANPCGLLAQANYLSVFGNAGCNNNNKMSCTVTPSLVTYTGIPDFDYLSSSVPHPKENYYKNSTYDHAGNLLFSVNADGIFDKNGDQFFDFGDPLITTFTPGCYLQVFESFIFFA